MNAIEVRARAAAIVDAYAARLGMDEFAADALSGTIRAIPVDGENNPALWCCHIIGPDDVHAAPDYETALRWAVMLNRVMATIAPSPLDDPNMPMCVAQVERWPGTAASHASALPASIEGMTPAVPA